MASANPREEGKKREVVLPSPCRAKGFWIRYPPEPLRRLAFTLLIVRVMQQRWTSMAHHLCHAFWVSPHEFQPLRRTIQRYHQSASTRRLPASWDAVGAWALRTASTEPRANIC